LCFCICRDHGSKKIKKKEHTHTHTHRQFSLSATRPTGLQDREKLLVSESDLDYQVQADSWVLLQQQGGLVPDEKLGTG
jgi:hypothetical protein